MSSRHRRALVLGALCFMTTACTTVDATYRGAVAYNRAFDQARNEILLLNILRARDGYPQQFSTISTVTGSMRGDFKVGAAVENLIIDAANKVTNSGEFGFRNPSVTISPLETKEFRTGMMTPVKAEFVNELLAQGWTPDVVHNLAVAGTAALTDEELASADREANVTVAIGDGMKMLREGAGNDYEVDLARGVSVPSDKLVLSIKKRSFSCVLGVAVARGCLPEAQHKVILRSPEGMIQYLAKKMPKHGGASESTTRYFKVIRGGTRRAPANAIVAARFRNEIYYIAAHDRTSLETLSLLAEVIGFQTTNAELSASKPVLTVAP